MPAAEGLCVLRRVSVVVVYVAAHDVRGVLGYIQTRSELILEAHPHSVLGAYPVSSSCYTGQFFYLLNIITHSAPPRFTDSFVMCGL